MSHFVKLATLDDLPPGSSREVEHDGRIIALFHLDDGSFWALDGMCAHQGGPLAQGAVHARVVTCPWHGWQFDLATGQALINARIRQSTYEVRIDGREVLVALP